MTDTVLNHGATPHGSLTPAHGTVARKASGDRVGQEPVAHVIAARTTTGALVEPPEEVKAAARSALTNRMRQGKFLCTVAFVGCFPAAAVAVLATVIVLHAGAPKTVTKPVPDLAASIAALGTPAASGSLSEIAQSVQASCKGWPVGAGSFVLVCQAVPAS